MGIRSKAPSLQDFRCVNGFMVMIKPSNKQLRMVFFFRNSKAIVSIANELVMKECFQPNSKIVFMGEFLLLVRFKCIIGCICFIASLPLYRKSSDL